MKLTDQEQVILKAIGHGVAEISRVIRAVGYPKATVKKILARLNEKGIVALHRHDYPQSLKPEQRKLMVKIGSSYYNAVSMRVRKQNPKSKHLRGATAKQQRQYEAILKSIKASGRYKGREKEVAARTVRARQNPKKTDKGKTALKKTGRALKGFARGALGAASQIFGAGAEALNPSKKKTAKRKRNRDYPYWNIYHIDTKKSPPYDKTFLGSSSFGMDKKEAIAKFRQSHYPGRLRAGTKIVAEKGIVTMNPKRKRNASRTVNPTRKTKAGRARASSKTGRKKATPRVRSVVKARKGTTRRLAGRAIKKSSGLLKKRERKNPSAEGIRKKFAGSVNGERDLFFPQGTPQGLAKLGKLVSITTEEGTIKPVAGTAWLCADTKERLHIGSTSNAPLFDGPKRSFGKVSKVEYEGAKPHLGYKGPIIWFHHMGEVSGHRPTLYADGKGGLVFKGGQYRLTKRGIEN